MTRRGNWQRSFAVYVAGWLALAAVNVFASDAPTNWRSECVGRFQVSVPGEVEVALTTLPAFTDPNFMNRYRFEDGSVASYSIGYSVSPEMTTSDFKKVRDAFNKEQLNTKRELTLSGQAAIANAIRPIKLQIADAFGWGDNDYADLFFYVGSHLFGFNHQREGTEDFKASFAQSFHRRPLYDIPKGEGVCIPYGFIADDGKPGRDIGVTMRLKDHPEVEIFFEDQTAPRPYKEGAHLADSEHLNAGFWDIKSRRTKRIEVLFPGYRSIQLDGRTGTASFAEITQKDGIKDYGFVAAVAGDYTAKTDTPELMLYVIRTASRAKGTPISKSELKDIAYKISASIKRRETTYAPGEKAAR